jgi:tRNA pseudouridine55 synthase
MIACINKPEGPSSFAVVQAVKKILGEKKAGHIGTLDPLAEGVLPICLNGSTRIIQFLVNLTKVYKATLVLGSSTDTQDRTGNVLTSADASNITEQQVREALQDMVGEQLQMPPMFSAKKKDGVPLYKLARNGISVDREPVPINIFSIEFLGKEGNEVSFRAHCSSGTYIRTLCHDVGENLGCGGHMGHLVREQVGSFRIENSISLEDLKTAHADANVTERLHAMDGALDFLPEIKISTKQIQSIINGISLSRSSVESYPEEFKPGMNIRVTNGNSRLIAIVEPLIDQDKFAKMPPDDIAFKLKRVLA